MQLVVSKPRTSEISERTARVNAILHPKYYLWISKHGESEQDSGWQEVCRQDISHIASTELFQTLSHHTTIVGLEDALLKKTLNLVSGTYKKYYSFVSNVLSSHENLIIKQAYNHIGITDEQILEASIKVEEVLHQTMILSECNRDPLVLYPPTKRVRFNIFLYHVIDAIAKKQRILLAEDDVLRGYYPDTIQCLRYDFGNNKPEITNALQHFANLGELEQMYTMIEEVLQDYLTYTTKTETSIRANTNIFDCITNNPIFLQYSSYAEPDELLIGKEKAEEMKTTYKHVVVIASCIKTFCDNLLFPRDAMKPPPLQQISGLN